MHLIENKLKYRFIVININLYLYSLERDFIIRHVFYRNRRLIMYFELRRNALWPPSPINRKHTQTYEDGSTLQSVDGLTIMCAPLETHYLTQKRSYHNNDVWKNMTDVKSIVLAYPVQVHWISTSTKFFIENAYRFTHILIHKLFNNYTVSAPVHLIELNDSMALE